MQSFEMWRKTQIKKEQWMKIDDWYVRPGPFEDDYWHVASLRRPHMKDAYTPKVWQQRLAHCCPDGSIRAPTSMFKTRKGKIYGYCSGCRAPLSKNIKTLIYMDNLNG